MDAMRRLFLDAPLNAAPPHPTETFQRMLSYLEWFPVLETVDVRVYWIESGIRYARHNLNSTEAAVVAQGEASLEAKIKAATSNNIKVIFHRVELNRGVMWSTSHVLT
jgi:hypothetical protein